MQKKAIKTNMISKLESSQISIHKELFPYIKNMKMLHAILNVYDILNNDYTEKNFKGKYVNEVNHGVPINSKKMQDIWGSIRIEDKNYFIWDYIKKIMINDLNIIEETHNYCVGVQCKHYYFTSWGILGQVTINVEDLPEYLLKEDFYKDYRKVKKYITKTKKVIDKIVDSLDYNNIEGINYEISIIENKLNNIIESNGYNETTIEFSEEYIHYKRKLEYFKDWTSKLINKDYTVSECTYSSRLSSLLTGMPKELKGHINYLYEIDCKNSQFVLLSHIIYEKHKTSDVKKFRELAGNGVLYEYFVDKFKLSRSEVKELFMQTIFDQSIIFNDENNMSDLEKALREDFPTVYKFIIDYHTKHINHKCEHITRKLQSLEASIWIHEILAKQLVIYDVATIHDSIVVIDKILKPKQLEKIVKDAFKKFGIKASFEVKIKNKI